MPVDLRPYNPAWPALEDIGVMAAAEHLDAVVDRREASGRSNSAVTYDERLAERIRAQIADLPGTSEKRMFGGLAFLLGGHMAVAAGGSGDLMVRASPGRVADLVATTSARPMEMRGRPMRGWLHVSADDLADDGELARWITIATAYVRDLPAKA